MYNGINKKLVFAVLLILLTAILIGCGPKEPEKNSITILIYANPAEFNGFNIGSGLEEAIGEMVMLSLAEIDPMGNYYPELATEIPTLENGGVVMDEETWVDRYLASS